MDAGSWTCSEDNASAEKYLAWFTFSMCWSLLKFFARQAAKNE